MRTTLEKPEIIRLIAKALGIKHLTPDMVHIRAEPFEVTIMHDALASAIPPKEVVKEEPKTPTLATSSSAETLGKKLKRPHIDETPLNFSTLLDHNAHVPRPDRPVQSSDTYDRPLRANEFPDIGPTDKEGREF